VISIFLPDKPGYWVKILLEQIRNFYNEIKEDAYKALLMQAPVQPSQQAYESLRSFPKPGSGKDVCNVCKIDPALATSASRHKILRTSTQFFRSQFHYCFAVHLCH